MVTLLMAPAIGKSGKHLLASPGLTLSDHFFFLTALLIRVLQSKFENGVILTPLALGKKQRDSQVLDSAI